MGLGQKLGLRMGEKAREGGMGARDARQSTPMDALARAPVQGAWENPALNPNSRPPSSSDVYSTGALSPPLHSFSLHTPSTYGRERAPLAHAESPNGTQRAQAGLHPGGAALPSKTFSHFLG